MKRDDRLWKGILENLCDDFLRFFFKESEKMFDMERGFQFLDKELEQLFPVENSQAPKFVDKLVKVFTNDGDEEWVLVHVEVQGYKDEDFGKRMFTYFYRILDRYDKAVTALAIYTDGDRKFHPLAYEYEFLGTINKFSFNTYKIIDQDEQRLMVDENPFAVVILTVLLALRSTRGSDDDLYHLKFSLAKNLLRKNIPRKKIDDLLIFLQLYVTFADSQYSVKFDKEIEEITQNQKSMGIRELALDLAKRDGQAKGIREGKVEVVKNLLLAERFTIPEIANFANVTEDFVLTVKKSLN